jgi:bifunctional DNA-binding transcriptional regulator/antitoxin component of YhaV-PrlF toxin-antitoxin module
MQLNELAKTSKVTIANTISKSLRATIPNDVVEYLGLKAGDVIEWETLIHNGKHSARIRKLQ